MELQLPPGNRTDGNCGVTAVAAVAGVHFDKAFEMIKQIENRKGNWKGGSYTFSRRKALTKLGIKFEETVSVGRSNPSLKKWISWYARKGDVYIVSTSGHVQVVHGKTVLDQRGPAKIEEYWGRNKRVKNILKINNPVLVAKRQPDTVAVEPNSTGTNLMKPNKNYIVKRLSAINQTQMSLAAELKIDRAQVTRLLNGERKVQLDEVPTMARFLDISTIEMLRNLGLDV